MVMSKEELIEQFGDPIDLTPVDNEQLLAEGWPVDEDGKDITNAMYGRSHSEETIRLFSEQRTGYKQKEITVARRAAANTGQTRTPEQRRNLALGQIGNPKAPTLIIMKCEVCDKEMNLPNYMRYHKNCEATIS